MMLAGAGWRGAGGTGVLSPRSKLSSDFTTSHKSSTIQWIRLQIANKLPMVFYFAMSQARNVRQKII